MAVRFARSGCCAAMPTAHLARPRARLRFRPGRGAFPAEHRHHRSRRAAAGEARPGALLTPQGKILFDFLISRAGRDAFLLECRADVADDFIRRLTLYKLRAKVEISKQDQSLVAVSWEIESGASHSDSTSSQLIQAALRDQRFPADRSRRADLWRGRARRATDGRHGTPSASPTALRRAARTMRWATLFRMTCCSTRLGGVGFRKGCYVGQEVVSRMQHRGTARRRVLIVTGGRTAAATRNRHHGGRPLSRHARVTVAGNRGLAIAAHRPGQGRDGRRHSDHWQTACPWSSPSRPGPRSPFRNKPPGRRRPDGRQARRAAARLAAHAVGPAARSARPLAARRRDRRHRAWTGARRALERPDRAATTPSRWRSIRCWSRRSSARLVPGASPDARLAALLHDAPGICDRRHDLAVQIGGRRRLQGRGAAAAARHPSALFACPAEVATGLRKDIKRADQIAAYFEATLLAGFSIAEATQFFGRPRGIHADRFDLSPRPARKVQTAFMTRFSAIEKTRG